MVAYEELLESSALLAIAYRIAFVAHQGQMRDDKVTPHVFHCIRVASHVACEVKKIPGNCFQPYMPSQIVAAAVLHDAPEDCKNPSLIQEIRSLDNDVYDLAMMLRNPSCDHPDESREVRKKMDREHMLKSHPAAVLIKFIDRMDNLSDSRQKTGIWSGRKKGTYCEESWLLLPCLARWGTAVYPRDSSLWEYGIKLQCQLAKTIQDVEASIGLKEHLVSPCRQEKCEGRMTNMKIPEFVTPKNSLVKDAVVALCNRCGMTYISDNEHKRWEIEGKTL